MPALLDLSAELLLSVAYFLPQVDLLNVSLTCKLLHDATEPELYREYNNTRRNGRSIVPYLLRLIAVPKLTKYVRFIDFKPWGTLNEISPEFDPEFPLRDEPVLPDYYFIARAAQAAGVIKCITPFSKKNIIAETVNNSPVLHWDLFHDGSNPIPYDEKFCLLLRAGVEDAYVVLLMAILPNLREVFFNGMPYQETALRWRFPVEGGRKLRRLSALANDPNLSWALQYLNEQMQAPRLEELEVCGGGSLWLGLVTAPLQLPQKSLNITRLTLQCFIMTQADMQTLLSACRTLKSFYYSAPEEGWDFRTITYPELVELLLMYKETLEEIAMDLDSLWDYDDASPRTIASLSDFSSLKTIDISPGIWSYEQETTTEPRNDIPEEWNTIPQRLPKFHH
ncbi:hypothetical protein CC80DRAFT_531548 [Byssothecium circinans]|uniref:F-box domain-containing protein n=1 Tax=Byssothecium circinans TaxID=147558 RepID=A0A6A5UA00_9PLEO|nr:hypothetical protein CC80DRAFT_531548 [Byssothecium circinans]